MKKIHMLLVVAVMLFFVVGDRATGYPPAYRKMMLTGPWEIVVTVGSQEVGIAFPVSVDDENVGQKMNKDLPIMKTPVKVKLVEYVPDLQWLTSAEKNEKGQSVALVTIEGPNLDQQIWLDSSDDKKKSVVARGIGSVAVKHLYNQEVVKEMKEKLKTEKRILVLRLWPEKSGKPLEYAVAVSDTVKLANSKYSFKVLRYVPHYLIDKDSKEVSSGSDLPVNPAIELEVSDGNDTFRQWLWLKYESPHMANKLPFKVAFDEVDLREQGNYIIASVPGASSEIFYLEGEKIAAKKVSPDEKFMFADPNYFFKVSELHHTAVLKKDMQKNSGELLNPAIIATIEYAKTKSQAILEYNKPYYYSGGAGSMNILFRKNTAGAVKTFGE